MNTQALYEEYHANCGFDDFGKSTFHGEKAHAAYPDAKTVLDFGCGNGYAVRKMRAEGRDWSGVEYSRAAYEQHLREPFFHVGSLEQFADRQFDLIYSTEVLEHIPEEQVDRVAAELCRVAAKYLFFTISLRPSSENNRFHCTLRPRAWWEAKFMEEGYVVDRPVVDAYQVRTLQTTTQILRKWSHLGPIPAEFAENPPYELCGETQFWFFAFRRPGVPPQPAPTTTVAWHQRTIVPWLRWALRMDPAHH